MNSVCISSSINPSFSNLSPNRKFLSIKICFFFILLALSALQVKGDPVIASSVLYSDDPTASKYAKINDLLDEVYGSGDPSSGAFTETEAQYFEVTGTGQQSVDFTFLYDGGGYSFEFGFFYITDELLALPTDTVQQKQEWAIEALSTAQTVIVDRQISAVPNGAIKAVSDGVAVPGQSWSYSGERSSVNTNTLTIEGGSRLGFYIIPDNTLDNFINDHEDNGVFNQFSINGSWQENDKRNWPLFSVTDANPGLQSGNTGNTGNPSWGDPGTNPDQVMTFDGVTQDGWLGNGSSAASGTMVSFEDLWRRPNQGNDWWKSSDNDFEDLVFHIGNVSSVPVPEASTVFAGIFSLLSIVGLQFVRSRRRNKD